MTSWDSPTLALTWQVGTPERALGGYLSATLHVGRETHVRTNWPCRADRWPASEWRRETGVLAPVPRLHSSQAGAGWRRRAEQKAAARTAAESRIFDAVHSAGTLAERMRTLISIDIAKAEHGEGISHDTYEVAVIETHDDLRRLRLSRDPAATRDTERGLTTPERLRRPLRGGLPTRSDHLRRIGLTAAEADVGFGAFQLDRNDPTSASLRRDRAPAFRTFTLPGLLLSGR